jgi:hypothetical protein
MRIQPETPRKPPGSEKNTVQACGACRYYLQFPKEDPDEEEEDEDDDDDEDEDDDDDEPDPEMITGICRRYPPYPSECGCRVSLFPEVAGKTGWCGEFLPL